MEDAPQDFLLDTCLLAGKIMMESGAEMYRVEDTMSRIAEAASESKGISFVTPTGIFMALQGGSTVKMEQIPTRTIDLEKVSKVNDLSREFTMKQISLGQFYTQLRSLDKEVKFFPIWLQIVAAAVVSGTLMMIFGGVWKDLIATCMIGAIGFIIFYYGTEFFKVKFLAEFLAAFTVGLLSVLAISVGWGVSLDKMIIGGVMPLVPGVPITNAVRDLLAGHLLSGMARGTEALITAGTIGIGIAVVFRFFG
ncbi:threonine/serine exporter family protein [Listeria grandensis]|uniref:Threonine/serine exporter family protein n=1 Tax=Listeria grandensis TaxID=1494963 RepID=A0A7X0Y4U4_9LIST|nr:threonine/serine exporter family protein [Listeria grandensis]MBC1936798.1 threonine/serine exporter family protein [Listeria grandensis]MBC6314504.1 threonine/serine exporter family protein [Listeria grandensis]